MVIFFEIIIPVIMFFFIIFSMLFNLNFIKPVLDFLAINIEKVAPLFLTFGTVICGVVLTSLSVLGSTVSHSIVKISKDSKMTLKFIFLATLTLFSSGLLLVLSCFFNLVNIKFYLLIISLSISSVISYTTIIIYIFYINIKNIEEDKQSSETLLGEIRTIKQHVDSSRISIEEINNKLKAEN